MQNNISRIKNQAKVLTACSKLLFLFLAITLVVSLSAQKIKVLEPAAFWTAAITMFLLFFIAIFGSYAHIAAWLQCRKKLKKLQQKNHTVSATVHSLKFILGLQVEIPFPVILELEVDHGDKKIHFIDYTWKIANWSHTLRYLPEKGEHVEILYDAETGQAALKRPLKAFKY